MNAMSIAEIAKILNLHPKAVKSRLIRAGLKPVEYAGPTGMYNPAVVDIIREAKPAGRPKKPKQ
jgi:predicted ArsR family transcriptional regulator